MRLLGNYSYILKFIFLLIFFGCSKNKITERSFRSFQQEAKFADIPVPLDIEPLNCGISANSYAFQTSINLSEFLKFFIQEMEIFGWDKKYHISTFEELLIFEKPNKIAVISIRTKSKKLNIFVFIQKKTDGENI